MMNNLSIENLNRTLQVDPIGGGRSGSTRREDQLGGAGTGFGTGKGAASSFSAMLSDSIDKVNEAQVQSDTAIKELVSGRSKNIHETMLTIERADTALKLMMQVRNKLIDAYREVMRMQI